MNDAGPEVLAVGVKVMVSSPLRTTVPPMGSLTAVTVSGPPSMSVSLPVNVAVGMTAAVSSGVVMPVSLTASGGSLTGVMVTVTWPVSVSRRRRRRCRSKPAGPV